MIFPEFFPEDRKNELAELKAFEQLKRVSEEYDIFYSRKFISDGLGKKPEYEVDFIISIPEEAIICLEVKGGLISYSGIEDKWTQNGRTMSKRPDAQSTSASHSLAHTFSDLIAGMPVGWALCFPDCDLANNKQLPSSIASEQIIDQLNLLHIDQSLPLLFDFLKKQYPTRTGVRKWQYEKFKTQLLRGLGFVQVLSSKIKYDEERFIQLTNHQLDLFKRVAINKNILTRGPAGSGKTIVAKTLAQDFLNNDKKVLFLCFNRTLANKVRYEFDKYDDKIEVTTFHSLARRVIEKFDSNWWGENKSNDADEFWNLDIPVKLEECLSFVEERYDVLIIDEGQDFKELWFELIFKLIKPDGHKLIFLDEMQNIFGHYTSIPEKDFIRYSLPENCRNTKNIVNHLSNHLNQDIKSFVNAPIGEEVIVKSFKNQIEEQKYLLDEIKSLTKNHSIESNQILILLNSAKADSCIQDTLKAGVFPFQSVDNKGRLQKDTINYTTINTYKGLEADIVFVLDIHLILEENKLEKLYTEASRARHKLYLLSSS